MGNKKKFDKLEVNENYYKTHADEDVYQKDNSKKNGGLFLGIFSGNAPDKKKPSNKFTYTREKRKIVQEKKKTSDIEAPAKAPFVFMLIVILLVLLAGSVTTSSIFQNVSVKKAATVKCLLMVGVYFVPTVIYIVSSSSRRKFYNIRPFSPSMMSTTLISLGLVMSLTMLQKYFITYTFGYNVPASTPAQGVLVSIAVGALVPAICEELFVRGVLQYEISGYAGGIGGILVCGLVFAIMHFDLQYFTVYLVAGLVLSTLTHITHSVFPAMLVHFLNNTISILFSDKLSYIALRRVGGTLFMIILACLAFLFLIFLLRHVETISTKRALEFSSETSENENEQDEKINIKYDEARFFLSPNGRTVSRLAKTFTSPFLVAVVVVFIIVVVIKQSM